MSISFKVKKRRMENRKVHWENIFQTKDTSKVSWYQEVPQVSINLIAEHLASKNEAILDVGAGDSRLPDFLLKSGYKDLSVLDISSQALSLSKKRVEKLGARLKWIETDILNFKPGREYSLWHDRAVYHFLSTRSEQIRYKSILLNTLKNKGIAIISGFSKNNGPHKCSGLSVNKLNRESLQDNFGTEFTIIDDFEQLHLTPSGSKQNFYWAILKKNIVNQK